MCVCVCWFDQKFTTRSYIYYVYTIYIETHSQAYHCKLKFILTISLNSFFLRVLFSFLIFVAFVLHIRHIKRLRYKACHYYYDQFSSGISSIGHWNICKRVHNRYAYFVSVCVSAVYCNDTRREEEKKCNWIACRSQQ